MTNWKLTGLIATLIIVLTIPAYMLKEKYSRQPAVSTPAATFVGSQKCKDCHKSEYDKWQGSHHDLAMDEANETTVLGDYNDAVFEHFDVTSRFYRKNGRFFVYTQGAGGDMGEFEVKYVFGVYPLQQYLVPFPGGRLQSLPIAWDVKTKKWYHLYPDAPIDPGDWLYWTNAGQNWNGMCAECHSTNLIKNYDIETDTYQTTWSDIDVGCEACHGPGSGHVGWAEMPDMARPAVENYRLMVKTSELGSRKLVELCAPCHSRRAILGDYTHAEPDLMDSMLPSLLTDELYFADGYILEEVYVYGSFTQSKMYHRDVRCSDCHDVHSTKTIREGNNLCLQCHRVGEYDTTTHHFHKKRGEKGEPIKSGDGTVLFEVGTGAECVQCHMPGRYYMGIDYRPDHGFRIPRPDLTVKMGTPNACNRCHTNKSGQWSDETITKWYGPGRRTHYGTVIDAGRKRMPEARKNLIRLAGDPLYPVIVRATALSLLNDYPVGEDTERVFVTAMMDDEALIRRTAAEGMRAVDPERNQKLISSLLYDPVKAVRIEAASRLTGEPSKDMEPDRQKILDTVLKEYIASMNYNGDFAFGRHNLGNLYTALNRPQEAIRNYRAAVKIDNRFFPAKVNLAMLYNQLGKKDETEALLREVANSHPEVPDVAYSLGLLLAERKNYAEAAVYLEKAASGMPGRARIHYNLGLLRQYLGRDAAAEASFHQALVLEPDNLDFLYAAADFYVKRGKFRKARPIAEQMIARYPKMPVGHDLLRYIDKNIQAEIQ